MANPNPLEENLIPMTSRSPEERRQIASKGAKATNKIKAEKKRLRKAAEILLDTKVPAEKLRRGLKEAGVQEDDMTYAMLITLGQIQSASKGNSQAYANFMRLLGEDQTIPDEQEKAESGQVVINIMKATEKDVEIDD